MTQHQNLDDAGVYVGRIWRPDTGPSLVTLRNGQIIDITTKAAPTMRDLLELPDPLAHVQNTTGTPVCTLDELDSASHPDAGENDLRYLAPCDLQAIKACGVTFARSMLERVIEERAGGDAARADAIRAKVSGVIGDSLRDLVPGSAEAARVKAVLQAENLWSQYLEVGIGPDAEVFTKAQPMSAVGHGAAVGLHPSSSWNNPEPEIVLACASDGRILGACLGNDVNLRDIEGRSALLLGKAKDNNASAALGPFIRLFDDRFGLDDIRTADLDMTIDGVDGFQLTGHSSMREISRDPADLAAQTCGAHHQYPDGFMLYLGTMFAPVADRDAKGAGFTHHAQDRVTISTAGLGQLVNTVMCSTKAPRWNFGTGALMRNLVGRGLL